jgi:hypothetical protein
VRLSRISLILAYVIVKRIYERVPALDQNVWHPHHQTSTSSQVLQENLHNSINQQSPDRTSKVVHQNRLYLLHRNGTITSTSWAAAVPNHKTTATATPACLSTTATITTTTSLHDQQNVGSIVVADTLQVEASSLAADGAAAVMVEEEDVEVTAEVEAVEAAKRGWLNTACNFDAV